VTLDDAPEYTEARVLVGSDVDGYLCSFVALPEHKHGVRGSVRAWAEWTAVVREHVADAWPGLELLEVPEAKPLEPVPPLEIRYEHDHELWLPVDDGIVHAYQGATREHRIVVVQEWRAWGSTTSGEYDAPRVTWHRWARSVAADLDVAVGWASIEGQTIDAGHNAAEHVQRVLVEAARRVEAPAGIEALDLRGLTFGTVETLVRALVDAARGRYSRDESARGAIVLCDRPVAVYLWRSVPLTFD